MTEEECVTVQDEKCEIKYDTVQVKLFFNHDDHGGHDDHDNHDNHDQTNYTVDPMSFTNRTMCATLCTTTNAKQCTILSR